MRCQLAPVFLAIAASAFATSESRPARSSELPAWTSNDDRTIHARFLGVGPKSVLIEVNGTTFVVPFARLSAESVSQARRLGGLRDERNRTAQGPGLAPNQTPSLAAAKSGPQAPGVSSATAGFAVPDPRRSHARIAPLRSAAVTGNPGAVRDPAGIELRGRVATATVEVPTAVQRAIAAGNTLQTKPYKYGGGRSPLEDTGYDCSGSVSYVLIKAGLLDAPRTSRSFSGYGEAGPGKWITIYARPGHVFMTVCGLRLDTGGRGGIGESGPRWSPQPRGGTGWAVRHPPGF